MIAAKAWIAGLASLWLVCAALPADAADSLPMPVARYAELCQQSGGSAVLQLTGGVGLVQCQWPGQGRTDCKVGANQVSVCSISCQSNACLKENTARLSPRWPLNGGPNSAAPPTLPNSGTAAPSN